MSGFEFLAPLAAGLLGSASGGSGNSPSGPTINISFTTTQSIGDVSGSGVGGGGTATGGAGGAASAMSEAAAKAQSDAAAQARSDAKAAADAVASLKKSSADSVSSPPLAPAAPPDDKNASTLSQLGNYSVLLLQRIKRLEEQVSVFPPIGSIIAWHRTAPIDNVYLPQGWVRCDGQTTTISTHTYDALGVAKTFTKDFQVPNLNGGAGRFLRGTTGPTGVEQADAIKSHNHGGMTGATKPRVLDESSGEQLCRVQMFHQGPAEVDVWRASWGPQAPGKNPHGVHGFAFAENHSHTIAAEGGDESRPINTAFCWIMRVF